MPPHVLVDFVVFPPGNGRSVTDFWGWDAHEARLRFPDDVSGDVGVCSARRALKPKFYQPTQTMVTAGILPFRENSHGRTGNRTRDLMISSQSLTTRPRGWSVIKKYGVEIDFHAFPLILDWDERSAPHADCSILAEIILIPIGQDAGWQRRNQLFWRLGRRPAITARNTKLCKWNKSKLFIDFFFLFSSML